MVGRDRMARPTGLPQIQRKEVQVPADVPPEARQTYIDNFLAATRGTGRLLLIDDALIEDIRPEDTPTATISSGGRPTRILGPERSFVTANDPSVGMLATSLGLLARYGSDFAECNYLVKLNGLTNLAGRVDREPFFNQLWSVEQVLDLIDFTKLKIRAVGYSLHLGSKYQPDMLQQAAQVAIEAHSAGLLVIFRVHSTSDSKEAERDSTELIDACRSALELGADFVVVRASDAHNEVLDTILVDCVLTAGRTGVVATGNGSGEPRALLEQAYDLVNSAGVAGYSTGPSINGLPEDQARRTMEGLTTIIHGGHDVAEALKVYERE